MVCFIMLQKDQVPERTLADTAVWTMRKDHEKLGHGYVSIIH